jgi:pimeloyl-ACP methyl ester carboxylesterase
MLRQPGAVESTLAYYRAMFRRSRADPELEAVRARLTTPITVPTRVLCGSRDMRREMLPRQHDLFTAPYDWQLVEGTGHFLHRERPQQVNELILDWLAASS